MALSSRAHIPPSGWSPSSPTVSSGTIIPHTIVFPQEAPCGEPPPHTHTHALRKALVSPQNSRVYLPSPQLWAFWAPEPVVWPGALGGASPHYPETGPQGQGSPL